MLTIFYSANIFFNSGVGLEMWGEQSEHLAFLPLEEKFWGLNSVQKKDCCFSGDWLSQLLVRVRESIRNPTVQGCAFFIYFFKLGSICIPAQFSVIP